MDYVLTCSPTGIELNEADRIDHNHVPIRTMRARADTAIMRSARRAVTIATPKLTASTGTKPASIGVPR